MPLRIALIDSGVNRHHFHVGEVAGGHGYRLNGHGQVVFDPDFEDEIGHGTAIAGVLSQKAPFASVYAVKIFQRELVTSSAVLMAALRWAIEKQMKIIHLSLGTEVEAYREEFKFLCRKAYDAGIIVSAAARYPGDSIIPAAFETVIGVCWDRGCDKDTIRYYPGETVEFGAHGWPRDLPGMPPELNFRGNSFAAAHVTSRAAQIVEEFPNATPSFVRERLRQFAVTR